MTRPLAAALAVVGLLAVALAGCGGGSSQPAGSIKVTMTDFKFTPNQIPAKAGKVDFLLVNSGSTPHDMVVSDSSGKQIGRSELVQPGNTAELTIANVPAGTYSFQCDQPGHAQQGMTGTLTVG